MVAYTVEIDGNTITYGAYTLRSRFSDKEWSAIFHEMAKQNYPDEYEKHKHDNLIIKLFGNNINLSERYEALLELLPQSSFSKAGTHPVWVANEVAENTLNKEDTQDDVRKMVQVSKDLDDLKTSIIDYFEIHNSNQSFGLGS